MICQTLNIFAINRANFHSFCAPLNAFQKQAIHLKYVSRNNVFVIDNVNYQLSNSVFYCAILKNKLDSYRLLHTLWIQAIGNSIYLSVKTFSLGLFLRTKLFLLKTKKSDKKNQSKRVTFQSNFVKFSTSWKDWSFTVRTYLFSRETLQLVRKIYGYFFVSLEFFHFFPICKIFQYDNVGRCKWR